VLQELAANPTCFRLVLSIVGQVRLSSKRHIRFVSIRAGASIGRAVFMSFEIERKFLVSDDGWQQHVTGRRSIRQAYLATAGKASIRVRIVGEHTATLTIKSRPVDLRRLELEYPIPVLEAEALLPLRQGAIIEKVRHLVPWGDLTWEIDVFAGENAGLIIAEVELQHQQQHVVLPDWIGQEVTGQPQFYNSALVQHPFSAWSRRDARASKERLA
jgi:adenylate cyclase